VGRDRQNGDYLNSGTRVDKDLDANRSYYITPDAVFSAKFVAESNFIDEIPAAEVRIVRRY